MYSSENLSNMMEFLTMDEVPNWVVYSIVGSAFLVYYYYNAVKPPMLTCPSSKYKSFLESCLPVVSEKYWPTIWCFESRAQTILAHFLHGDLDIPYERDVVTLDDGGQVAIDWMHPNIDNKLAPITLILPGLTGSCFTSYIKKFSLSAHEAGFRSVIFNYRGLGGLALKTPRTYCATSTSDLVQVIQYVKNKYPGAPVGATGISLGALILGNYLSRHSHEERQLCAAMLISAPFDVCKAAENIEFGINTFLNKHLAGNLTSSLSRLRHVLDIDGKPWKMDEVLQSKTVREFDHKFTTKQFGYESVDHYYKDANLVDKLEKIRIPVLCLSAADDPFQPLIYPFTDSSLYNHDKVALLVTARGGHIAFLEGLWPFNKREEYMHRVFSQYFTAMFKDDKYQEFISSSS